MAVEFLATVSGPGDTFDHSAEQLTRLARAAEAGGFGTLQIGSGAGGPDSWVIASFLAARTSALRFLVPLRPGLVAPALFARQASTFDDYSGGRLSLSVVAGGARPDAQREPIAPGQDGRYRRNREFVSLVKRLFTEPVVDHAGEFYRVQQASLHPRPAQRPHPPFFIAGESSSGRALIAEAAQVYLTDGGAPADLAGRRAEVQLLAGDRAIGCCVSLAVVLGDTEAQAWARADDLRRRYGPTHAGDLGPLERAQIGPNLSAGLRQVFGDAAALVGTPDQVADRIADYVELGYDHVQLCGLPQLELIEQLGREVLPRVRARLADQPLALPGGQPA